MDSQQLAYVGEHLWPGNVGHFLILLGFVSSLLASYTLLVPYLTKSADKSNLAWERIGLGSFLIHSISILSVIGILFFLLVNKYYEYQYVFDHASEDLPMKYIFSAFWEGQEGSFLLWMFWHIILGLFILLFRRNEWRAPVLGTLSLIQVFLNSMILGIYYNGEDKMGSNPFTLVRDVFDAPIFAKADYLDMLAPLADGLNPLLQNYWMTIHPPTLFLGFAATSIPFCYAMAGLIKKDHSGWMKPTMPWALFAGAILGTGILMGGAWAYEALSFGGYWAWDPVENTSLVPWLLLIAGLHTHAIAKHTGHSIKSTYIFYALAFIMILYSTTLTRSGVLGDTSVHAFTEMGLEGQLLALIGFFTLLSIYLIAKNWRSVPTPQKEESFNSKEFWMFMGSLVLLFSAFLITFTTSIPVYNKLLDLWGSITGGTYTAMYKSTPLEPIAHYNKFQIWIAVLIGLLSGLAQFLRYRGTNWPMHKKTFWRKMAIHTLIAVVLTLLVKWWIDVVAWQYVLLLFSSCFVVSSNIDYLFSTLRGNLKIGASVLSHVGFGLFIVGILASGLNQEIITKRQDFADQNLEEFLQEDLLDNVFLVKNKPYYLGNFELNYKSDTIIDFERFYEVNIKKKNDAGVVIEEFDVRPSLVYEKGFKKFASSNPSIKRYAHQDIFTLIKDLPPSHLGTSIAQEAEDSLKFRAADIQYFSDFELENATGRLVNITDQVIHPVYEYQPGDIGITMHIVFERPDLELQWHAYPSLLLRGNLLYNYPSQINELSLRIKLKDELFERYYALTQPLNGVDTMYLKPGEKKSYKGNTVQFNSYDRSPDPNRIAQREGDIAVGARMTWESDGQPKEISPIYFIRDNAAFNIRSYLTQSNTSIRFLKLDPKSETIHLALQEQDLDSFISVEIAEDAPRDDYLVLQAKLFPGINLFWIGGLLMMIGLALGMYRRSNEKANA